MNRLVKVIKVCFCFKIKQKNKREEKPQHLRYRFVFSQEREVFNRNKKSQLFDIHSVKKLHFRCYDTKRNIILGWHNIISYNYNRFVYYAYKIITDHYYLLEKVYWFSGAKYLGLKRTSNLFAARGFSSVIIPLTFTKFKWHWHKKKNKIFWPYDEVIVASFSYRNPKTISELVRNPVFSSVSIQLFIIIYVYQYKLRNRLEYTSFQKEKKKTSSNCCR